MVFKKIAALATAIIMVVCFAVSASAVDVRTTTAYVSGTSDVKVNVTVTGVDEGANVTYYAIDANSNPVHIDQEKANGTTATFEFNTAAVNLESAVKIGYTGASTATDAAIDGYVITYPTASGTATTVIPTAATSVTFPYEVPSGQVLAANPVTVTNGTATVAAADISGTNMVVTFTAISSDVTLTVNTENAAPTVSTATAGIIEAAAVLVKANDAYAALGGIKIDGIYDEDKNVADANADKVDDRKLTVIGSAASSDDYGIIVSTEEITSGVYASIADLGTSYKAITKGDNNEFAIQLIDTSDKAAPAFVAANTAYYTAVYAKDANGVYDVEANASAVTAQ